MLQSFGFAESFCFQFQVSSFITGLNRTFELNVIVVLICYELPFSISSFSIYYGTQSTIRLKTYCRLNLLSASFSITSVSIYYGTQSDIRVKTYCRLNLLRAFVFIVELHDILWDTIGLPSKKLLSFSFSRSFRFQLRAARYITGLNQTSE